MRPSTRMQGLITKIAKAQDADLSEVGTHIKIKGGAFMDLVIETIGTNRIAVTHYYTQNGDMCQDPEIVFLVGCDDKWYAIEWTTPAMMLFGRVVGGWQRVAKVTEDDARKGTFSGARVKAQADLAIFANKWSTNLRRQGFLDRAKEK